MKSFNKRLIYSITVGISFMAKLANSNKQELIKASRESVSKYRYIETKNNMRRR